MQYADYAVWQRQWLETHLDEQLDYWKAQLRNLSVVELPADWPRPAVQTFRGASTRRVLSPELLTRLNGVGQQEGVTLYMILLAAFQTLLHRETGLDTIAVGSAFANRTRHEVEALIGFFVSTLVMNTDFSGNPTLRELLQRVREVTLGAFAHQDTPFEKLVEALQPERDPSRTPLVQVALTLQNATVAKPTLSNLQVEFVDLELAVSRFDLSLNVTETPAGLELAAEYSTDLFDEATIQRMMGHLEMILEAMATDLTVSVGEVPMLTPVEQAQVLEWNQTAVPYRETCLTTLFAEQVAHTPDAVAVVFEERQFTYRELNQRTNQLARRLQALGVGPEVLVGISVERSLEMIVAVLGVLKAGSAYVPFDPTYPPERLTFMLEDTQVPVILTQPHLVDQVPAGVARVVLLDSEGTAYTAESDADLPISTTPSNLAYVIYTSGSTGKPKGVLIEHRSAAQFIQSTQRIFGIDSEDRVLQFASLNFDVSVFEIFGALLSGATLVLARQDILLSPPDLTQLMQHHHVTITDIPPAVMALLDGSAVPDERIVFVGGEAFSGDLVNRWALPGRRFFNGYGPTEATVTMTLMECTGTWTQSPPIGKPMANHQVYLLDRQRNLVPIGVPGELYVGGTGLARGYLNRPELTADKFVANPFGTPSTRLYRTGDLARYLPDGNIEFLGRLDDQVKLRGLRIELGEIEAVLTQHSAVRQATVMVRDDASGQKRMVAYIAADADAYSAAELKSHLGRQLPTYMIPAIFVRLDYLPLSPSGKVDRRVLPEPDMDRTIQEEVFVAPRTEIEELLANGVFGQVLGLDQIGVNDNFFALGGNSLQAVQLVSRLRDTTEVDLPVRRIFEVPTVAGMAEAIGQITERGEQKQDGSAEDEWTPLVVLRQGGTGVPFFCIHASRGSVFSYAELARQLPTNRPFYGLEAPGIEDGRTPLRNIVTQAELYVDALRTVQPRGPYLLGGWSTGGLVAYEMAQQLYRKGEKMALLVLLDSFVPVPGEMQLDDTSLSEMFHSDVRGLTEQKAISNQIELILDGPEALRRRLEVFKANVRAVYNYELTPYAGRVTLLRATESPDNGPAWRTLVVAGLDEQVIAGNHYSIFSPERVPHLAQVLADCIDKALGYSSL